MQHPGQLGLVRLLLPLAYMAGLYLLSSIPDTDSPESLLERTLLWVPPAWQNLLHIPIYGGLALSWAWSLKPTPLPRRFILPLSLGLTVGWGILDELHQATVPGRFGSLTDMALNILGASLAILLIRYAALKPSNSSN